jgi:hypothetical protein
LASITGRKISNRKHGNAFVAIIGTKRNGIGLWKRRGQGCLDRIQHERSSTSVLQRLTGWAEYKKATWSAAASPRHSDITVLVSRDCTDINSGERSKLCESQITLCH